MLTSNQSRIAVVRPYQSNLNEPNTSHTTALCSTKSIIKSIKQRFNNSTKIRVEFTRKTDKEGRKRIIKIIHVGSACDKPLDKNELFNGDLKEAEKAFFGICDWSIISKTTDDSVNKLNILFDIHSDIMPNEKIDDSLIEGFTHLLTFYA